MSSASADEAGKAQPENVKAGDVAGTVDECVEAASASASAAGPAPATAGEAEAQSEAKPALPPLTPQEFKIYNRLAEHMDYFVSHIASMTHEPQLMSHVQHEHFRQTWTLLYDACKANKRPQGMSLKQFIDEGLSFIGYLTAHHNIEETYLFPILARKMPEFRNGSSAPDNPSRRRDPSAPKPRDNPLAAELLRQHRQIHAGMDVFEEYLRACRNRETELELSVLKEKMDSWGEVLWKHLDQEVRTLGAENMRKYWSIEEMRSLPI